MEERVLPRGPQADVHKGRSQASVVLPVKGAGEELLGQCPLRLHLGKEGLDSVLAYGLQLQLLRDEVLVRPVARLRASCVGQVSVLRGHFCCNLRAHQLIEVPEGAPQSQPLPKPAVVEDGQDVAGDELLALDCGLVDKGDERTALLLRGGRLVIGGRLPEGADEPLRDLAVLVALAHVLQQAHRLPAPGALLVERDRRRLLRHTGPRRKKGGHRATVLARRELLRRKIEPHLRFGWLVVEQDPPRHRESRSLVVQPLPGKAIRKFRGVGRDVLQQQSVAVAVQDVLVALRHLQRLREERAEAGLLLLLGVLQPGDPRLGVPAGRPRLHRPATVTATVGPSKRKPVQERPLSWRGRSAHLAL